MGLDLSSRSIRRCGSSWLQHQWVSETQFRVRYRYDPSPASTMGGKSASSNERYTDFDYFLQNMRALLDITEEALGGLPAPPPYVVSEMLPRYTKIVRPGMCGMPNYVQYQELTKETEIEVPTTFRQPLSQIGNPGPGKHRPLSTQGLPPVWENAHAVDEYLEVHTSGEEAHYIESHASHDLLRRKTLPSREQPPSGLGLNLKDRTISWSAGEHLNAHPRAQLHPSASAARPASMYVISSVNDWEPAPFHHPPHPPHPPPPPPPPALSHSLAPAPALHALVSQHPPMEYRPPPGMPTQNWFQQPNSGACIMPDVNHFVHYVTTVDDHPDFRDNLYPRSDEGYTDDNQVPRDWATAPPAGGRVVSPPRSPFSVFPEDFRSVSGMQSISAPHSPMAYSSPPQRGQNFTNRAGSTRCVAKYEYQGSLAHGEVSLQAGQLYDVIPQHDSPCKHPCCYRFFSWSIPLARY